MRTDGRDKRVSRRPDRSCLARHVDQPAQTCSGSESEGETGAAMSASDEEEFCLRHTGSEQPLLSQPAIQVSTGHSGECNLYLNCLYRVQ